MTCGIYKITNKINNKIYIGLSKNIEHRWNLHIKESKNEKYPQFNYSIHKAFRKYGLENFSFEIIEITDEEKLFEREIYWISFYDSYNNGYNETFGGDSGPSMPGEKNPNSKLTKQDIIEIRKLVLQCYPQQKAYMFFADKISFRQFQRIWRGESWKDIMPDAVDFVKTKTYLNTIRKNAQMESYSNKQKSIWKDISEKKKQGLSRAEVYKEYQNIYTQSGFDSIWYKTKENTKSLTKKVVKLDKETLVELQTYNSLAEAAKSNGCDSSSISKVCNGKKKSCGGYKWRYD